MKHGTERMYRQGACRCDDCYRAAKKADVLRATGRAGMVPTDRVVALFDRLKAEGWSDRDIACANGLDPAKVFRIRNGYFRKIRMLTQARILGADYSRPHPGSRVDGNGTRLRLRALHCMGYRGDDIAAATGIPKATLSTIASQDWRGTTAGVREAVAAAYLQLSNTPGPSNRARVRALHRGWLVPAALDDELLDRPGYTPDVTAMRRDTKRGTAREDVMELLAIGETAAAIAQRLGISVDAVHQAQRRRPA